MLKYFLDIPVLWIINLVAQAVPNNTADWVALGQLLLIWITIFYTLLKLIFWVKFHGYKIFKRYTKDK